MKSQDSPPPCRLLLTGFEPWGEVLRNPSGLLAEELGRDTALRRAGLVTAVLPVHLGRAPHALARLLRAHRPRVLLLTGVAVGRAEACVELRAVNSFRSAARPGVRRPLVPGGRPRLGVTLPPRPVVHALAAAGVPVRRSQDAGEFLCNAMLYHALSWAAADDTRRPAPARIGFLHLPATPGTLDGPRPGGPALLSRSLLRASLRELAWVLLHL